MPFYARDGGALAVQRSLQTLLSTGAQVHMLAVNSTKQWITKEQFESEIISNRNFEFVRVDTRVNAFSALLNLLGSHDYFTRRFYSKKMESRINELLAYNHFDAILLEHLSMAHYIKAIKANSTAPVILKAHNVESYLAKQLLVGSNNVFKRAYLKWQVRRLYIFEQTTSMRVDGIVAFTKEDASSLHSGKTDQKISVQPLPFLDSCNAFSENKRGNENSFYHIGSMDWWPNQEAMLWFLEKVWPLLDGKMSASFHFAGKQMPQKFYTYNSQNIYCDGEVESAANYHLQNGIMVVPLLSGSGIRVKIIEAMSLGKCIITTALGAQGIGCTHGCNILIADTAQEFAELICLCNKDSDYVERIGNEAKAFAHKYLSNNEAAQKCKAFLEECIIAKKKASTL